MWNIDEISIFSCVPLEGESGSNLLQLGDTRRFDHSERRPYGVTRHVGEEHGGGRIFKSPNCLNQVDSLGAGSHTPLIPEGLPMVIDI